MEADDCLENPPAIEDDVSIRDALDAPDVESFWEQVTARPPFGLTAKQVAFARALAKGHRAKDAALIAGYQDGSGIGVTASRMRRHEGVKRLMLAAAELDDAGKSDHAMPEEVLEVVTASLRHGTPTERLSAARIMSSYWSNRGGLSAQKSLHEKLNDAAMADPRDAPPVFLAATCVWTAHFAKGGDPECAAWRAPEAAIARLARYPEVEEMIRRFDAYAHIRPLSREGKATAGNSAAARARGNGAEPPAAS